MLIYRYLALAIIYSYFHGVALGATSSTELVGYCISKEGGVCTSYKSDPMHRHTDINYLFCNVPQDKSIENLIDTSLTSFLTVQNGNYGMGLEHSNESNHVGIDIFLSGGDDGENLGIFNTEKDLISQTYSLRHIGSIHGQFLMENGHNLYHTEPKAISMLLEKMSTVDNHISDVLMISKLKMCEFCSELLLRFMEKYKNNLNINLIVLSYDQFNLWTEKNKGFQLNTGLIDFINTSIKESPKGNKLILLTKYR